jgi:cytochrome c
MNKIFVTIILVFATIAVVIAIGNKKAAHFNKYILIQQNPSTDKGIGPFKNFKPGPVDYSKAKIGKQSFTEKCTACHSLDKVVLAPALGNITKLRTPEFILNMIVNPSGMQKSNEEIKKQMKKFNNLPMTDQKISQEEAKNIYEYLRSVAK